MTVITRIRKRSRLSKLIHAKGGVSVRAAVESARANLEPMRERGLEILNAHIDSLERHAAAQDRPPVQAVYDLASAIMDTAGLFDMTEVCHAAFNLCEIADRHADDAPFDWRVVDVHVRALRFLMTLPSDEAEARRAVLAGLGRITEHKTV